MKKKVSRILAMILSAAMICAVPASAANVALEATDKTASSETTKLVIWGHQEEVWNDNYRKIADEFMAENPDIEISFEFFPYDDFEAKVQTSLISKNSDCDIYEMWGGWGIDYAPTGSLDPIADEVAEEIRAEAYPSTYGAMEYDGKIYALPLEFNIECGGLVVNLHLLGEEAIPTTWDELVETAKKLTVRNGNQFDVRGFDFVGWDGVAYTFAAMIMSQGVSYFNEDGTFNVTSPEAKKAFEALTDLVVGEEPVTLENFQKLYTDQAVFVPHGPWVIADGLTTFGLEYGTDFDYVGLPWFGDEISFPAETGWCFSINAASQHKEAANRFLDYLFSDEVLMENNVACGQIPSKKSVATSEEYLEKFPYARPLVDILEKSSFIGFFNTDRFKEVIDNTFVDYCTGGIYDSIDAALADMEEKLNGIL